MNEIEIEEYLVLEAYTDETDKQEVEGLDWSEQERSILRATRPEYNIEFVGIPIKRKPVSVGYYRMFR